MCTKLQMKIFNIKVNSVTISMMITMNRLKMSVLNCLKAGMLARVLVFLIHSLLVFFKTSLSSYFIGAMFAMLFESYMNFLMVFCKWSLCNLFIAAMFAMVCNSVLTFGNLILSALWLQCLQWNLTNPCINFWWVFYNFPFVVGSFYLKSLQGYLIP